jgi:transcriptional regulator with XRE-family HTH domain
MTGKFTKQQYNLRRSRLIAYGTWQTLVDAEPVRQHIQQLQNAGLGWQRVAALAGVSTGAVSRILYGQPAAGWAPSKRIQPETATALLAVHADLDALADSARIDATGARRRIHALMCLGWTQVEQAERIGWTPKNYTRLHHSTLVRAVTARAIRAMYDDLSMTVAPDSPGATYARGLAKRRGYAPPLAWDDDTIDDPNAKPDLGEKVPSVDALLENLGELAEQRCEPEEIAARLGVTTGYLVELRRRARIKGIAA